MISTDKVFRLLLDWSPLAFVANPAADETVNFAACPAAASWITSVQVAMLIRVFCIRANFRRFKLQRRRQHEWMQNRVAEMDALRMRIARRLSRDDSPAVREEHAR